MACSGDTILIIIAWTIVSFFAKRKWRNTSRTLAEYSDGNLYGFTEEGGTYGGFFKYDLTLDTIISLVEITNISNLVYRGAGPFISSNGTMYAALYRNLLQFDPSTLTLQSKSTNPINKGNSMRSVGMQTSDGTIYLAYNNGDFGSSGSLIQYDTTLAGIEHCG